MIDIKALERSEKSPATGLTYLEEYRLTLKNRGADPAAVDELLNMNEERKTFISKSESLKAEQNKISQVIGQKKRNKEDASAEMAQVQGLIAELKGLEAKAAEVDSKVHDFALRLPNKLHASTPAGASEKDNVVVRKVGSAKNFGFKPLEHWELGEKKGWLDFERGAKVTGARFTFLRGPAARLERAVLNLMIDLHANEFGYEEIWPPFIVNRASLRGTGQLPKFEEDLFRVGAQSAEKLDTDYFLIPTAEVPVTNFFRDEVVAEDQLPSRFVAFSPCFRAEAGSYGKDTKGLIRQHQFDKVELMVFSHPSQSYETHEKLTSHAEEVLKRLELPYEVMALCSADIGFGAAKCYDLNVWLPGQNAFREISSCSNFEDFQARRANIRFKPKDGGKPQFVHTLNGSGLAVGRTVIAILENYQNEDGSVTVPKALERYVGHSVLK
jgi:seryl-tRNA synthetase